MRIRVIVFSTSIFLCNSLAAWAQGSQERPDIGPRARDAYFLQGRVVDERGASIRMARISLTPFQADIGQTALCRGGKASVESPATACHRVARQL
jgi:hypothetical protein